MRKKILLVEDNIELVELLRLNFKAAGFSVATAGDGLEAIRKARSLLPDLILLDLVLPELDGFAVCETLRRTAATAAIPILVLSGLSSQFARLAGIESGATDFFIKPASPAELIKRAKELLAGRQQSEAENENRVYSVSPAAISSTGVKAPA